MCTLSNEMPMIQNKYLISVLNASDTLPYDDLCRISGIFTKLAAKHGIRLEIERRK